MLSPLHHFPDLDVRLRPLLLEPCQAGHGPGGSYDLEYPGSEIYIYRQLKGERQSSTKSHTQHPSSFLLPSLHYQHG